MALGDDAELLGHLPLEEMGLGALGGEGRVAGPVQPRAADPQVAGGIVGQHGEQAQPLVGAEARQAHARAGALEDLVPELSERELGDVRQGHRGSVPAGGEHLAAHGFPSTQLPALEIMVPMGRGSQRPRIRERPRARTRGAVVAAVSL